LPAAAVRQPGHGPATILEREIVNV
jgi:hypothetical protein